MSQISKINCLVVGISGVTNGGKTILAKSLMNVLPNGTKLVEQDDYFRAEDSPLHVPSPGGISHHNYDVISALDMDEMVKDIHLKLSEFETELDFNVPPFASLRHLDQLVEQANVEKELASLNKVETRKRILLVEGFTLYDDPRLTEMCHLKFFFTLPKEVCFARRQTRSYEPPDPPDYFEKCVWPMYKAYYERVKKLPGIEFYDGVDRVDKIFISVLRKIVRAATS